MSVLTRVSGLEILDSRGRPTVQATCRLASGAVGSASVPAGASTGSAEAHELRDGDPTRYAGLGCRQAVRGIDEVVNRALAGRHFEVQRELDEALLELDGTPRKSRLGANAILAVSLAFCRAQAVEQGAELFERIQSVLGEAAPPPSLPRPAINLFSGGKHAGEQLPVQDLLLLPAAAMTMDEALVAATAVYRAASSLVLERYGMRLLRADEGGMAPPFESVEAMFDLAMEATEAAGLVPGRDILFGLDVAASHFFQGGLYHLEGIPLTSADMIRRLRGWLDAYPLAFLEDGLAEEDWTHWPQLAREAAEQALVVGDDLLCTHPARIRRAIDANAADTLLLKVNQVGTLSEAAEACVLARQAGWRVMASARSGETEDAWLADLAVGWGADLIKVGSITQSERLAKYNRLLEIEATYHLSFAFQPRR